MNIFKTSKLHAYVYLKYEVPTAHFNQLLCYIKPIAEISASNSSRPELRMLFH